MNTSVIIPTYQGANKISKCIDALLNQTNPNFEIIIAIDGSTDDTLSIVNEKLKNFPAFKIVQQDNKGRASIRNVGAKEATGQLLIFFDDDMRPFPNSVKQHILFHEQHENIVLQGTQIGDENNIHTDIQRYKYLLDQKWNKHLIEHEISESSPYISAAHFSVPKSIFEDINGFNEKLTDAEDYDLSIRLIENGFNIRYDHTIIAIHDDPITLRSYIHRKREYAKAHEKLKTIYPERSMKYYRRSFNPRTGWKALVYKIISSKNLVQMIDKEHPIVMILPKKIRYGMYDLVIQGLANYHPQKKL